MTAIAAPPAKGDVGPRPAPSGGDATPPAARVPRRRPWHWRPGPPKPVVVVLLWIGTVVVGLAAVLYGFGPILQERDQRRLLDEYRLELEQAAGAATGLAGDGALAAPQPGAPVGILEIGAVRLQQVVVEGVGPTQTQRGPGHLPGTAGLGQPGNSVVVGRRTAYGGPFGDLRQVDVGDPVVVTTVQGQSVYEVESVAKVTLLPQVEIGDLAEEPTSLGPTDDDEVSAEALELFGPTEGDQLTLVTSASPNPANASTATVVIAALRDDPFAPTAQNGRNPDVYGASPDDGAAASIVLAVVAYGMAMGLAVVLYRRLPLRIAYLLSAPAIVAATVITAETLTRALPAWL